MKTRAHLFIDGRVQRVFFRGFTREVAVSLGLKGWVRNLYDGRVEAVFEGEKDKILEAIGHCHQGPPFAVVTKIDTNWEEALEGFEDFTVRR